MKGYMSDLCMCVCVEPSIVAAKQGENEMNKDAVGGN